MPTNTDSSAQIQEYLDGVAAERAGGPPSVSQAAAPITPDGPRSEEIRLYLDGVETEHAAGLLSGSRAVTPDDAAAAVEAGPKLGIDANELARTPQIIQRAADEAKALAAFAMRPELRRFVNAAPVNASIVADEVEELGWFHEQFKKVDATVREGARHLFAWDRDDRWMGPSMRGLKSATMMLSVGPRTIQGVVIGKSLTDIEAALAAFDTIDKGGQTPYAMASNNEFLFNSYILDEGTGKVVSYVNATPEQRTAIKSNMIEKAYENTETTTAIALELLLLQSKMPQGEELSWENLPAMAQHYGTSGLVTSIPFLAANLVGGTGAAFTMGLAMGTSEIYGSAIADSADEILAGQIAAEPDLQNPAFKGKLNLDAATMPHIAKRAAGRFADTDLRKSAMIAAPLYAATEFLGAAGRTIRGPWRYIPDDLILKAVKASGVPSRVVTGLAMNSVEEGINEMLQSMIVGAVAGGPMGVAMQAPSIISQTRQAERARADGASSETLQQLQDNAPNIKLAKRSPKKWREFLQAVGTENGKFYVEPDALQAAVTKGQVTLEQVGVDEGSIEQAVELGGRVEITQLDWAANLAGTEAGQTILDNGSVNPDGFTPTQVRNFADIVAETKANSTLSEAQQIQLSDMRKELVTETAQKFRDAGQSPKVARASAEVWAQALTTLAERNNDLDIFTKYGGLSVEGIAQRTAVESVPSRELFQGPPDVRGGQPAASGNVHGLMPHLRVEANTLHPTRTQKLILTGTNNQNATTQLLGLDEVLERHPDAASTPQAWSNMMADALATTDVPVPPYAFINDINGVGATAMLNSLTEGQLADANHGFENARQFREDYVSGKVTIGNTGKLFLWSFLSRGVSPYTQESMFIDAFDGIDKFIDDAAAGTLNSDEYLAWAGGLAPKGAGLPAASTTHNLNAFGVLFLQKMSEDAGMGDGRSRLQVIHDMMSDPESTGRQIRRKFAELGEGVGIDNKVVSFTLLVAGFEDILVLDRVQMRQMWNDGRFDGVNLYDGYKVDKKVATGSGLANLTYGVRGLLIYEAMEHALSERIDAMYAAVNRPDDASVGRYHWETWVASSQQEASHATLDAILAEVHGEYKPLGGVTSKEGEYGTYAYGAQYGVSVLDGSRFFRYEVPNRGLYQFTVDQFRDFTARMKKPNEGVIPRGRFLVSETGNAPWFYKEGVNLDALNTLAGEVGTAIDPVSLQPADVANGVDQDVAYRPPANQSGSTNAARTLNQGEVDVRDGRGASGYQSGSLEALDGAPTVRGATGPDARIIAAAEQYASANGIDLQRQAEFAAIDPEHAAAVAQAYAEMEHAPNDPAVKAAYKNLIAQTVAQYEALIDAGYTFYFFNDSNDPYAGNPWNAMRDLRANQTMGVYSSEAGFGGEADPNSDNPLLQDTGVTWAFGPDGEQRRVLANDMFRAVHDAFGHGVEGAGFRAAGEENAWQAHVRLFTGDAVAAITTETRGQNSWLNYGPHGEANRTASVEDTVFAEQKTGLMPSFTWTEQRVGDAKGVPASETAAPDTTDPSILNQGNRGSLQIPENLVDGEFVLSLFESADESTALHEMGHAFIEIMRAVAQEDGASAQIVADLAAVHKWMADVTGTPVDGDYTTAQQEAWAEAFENYLYTGAAPTPLLRTIFRNITQWMKRLYESAGKIGIQPSPEISAVMDRLLATDLEIATAKMQTQNIALFSEKPPLMTQIEWDTYKRRTEEGETQAQAKGLAMAMRRLNKRRQKVWREAYKVAKAEALGGKDNQYGLGSRLDRDTLVSMFGADILNDMKALKTPRLVYVKDGSDPDQVAEVFGFRNGASMVQAMRTVLPINEQADLNAKAAADELAP